MTSKSVEKLVVLGVTGSIAAYKACEIASTLTKAGINVVPVLTDSAQEFVGAASFEGITHNTAITRLFEPEQNASIDHIEIAKLADLFLIAPATANIIAKAARGIADDWLSTALLATHAPVLFAPAMNPNMYEHPATQANLELLWSRGSHFVGPGDGVLACKTVGTGRMMEPVMVVEAALALLNKRDDLAGRSVLLTSGGNREPIDPVRFIGNRSSGKMGHALASEALHRGAGVTVVSGPSEVPPPPGAVVINVETAVEMCEAVMDHLSAADVVVGAAAVADYRAEHPQSEKHKRDGTGLTIKLIENPDIMASVGKVKDASKVLVGFAAETQDLIENARAKLEKKNLDLIVANQVGGDKSTIGSESVRASILDREGKVQELDMLPKRKLAEALFDRIIPLLS